MKPVQLLFDEELLAELDSDERVQRVGRSEVLRELAASYLRKRRETALDARYIEGYGGDSRVSEELQGWVEEGVWPDD
jgi:metal-responsive CopG/Arc/MetJ family transcriptional regulator